MRNESGTIAAISTAMSNSGIGIVRMSGEEAVEIAERIYKGKNEKKLSKQPTHTIHYGYIVDGEDTIDEVLVMLMRGPHSYTGEDTVEINCHGGVYVVRRILETVIKYGARPADPGEFTKRAFLNGKMDLTQAESVATLISSQGEASLKASFNALQGSLSTKINSVLQKLLDCSAVMAAWVDYPDEEIEELSNDELIKTLSGVKNELYDLLKGYDNGQTITNGVSTAIVGRANVGKSSLMNMLTGTDKSIVTDIAGTTRDIVEEDIKLGNIVLHLRDTAGLRDSDDVVESIGIQKAYKALDDAGLILAVFDNAQTLTDFDRDLIEKCKGKKAVAIINKTDLDKTIDSKPIEEAFEKTVYICAAQSQGVNELEYAVSEVLGVADFDSSAPMLANARQKANCQNAYDCICRALDDAQMGITFDAINVMIDSAADELLSLTGKKATTEVVNNIFSKFCVGK